MFYKKIKHSKYHISNYRFAKLGGFRVSPRVYVSTNSPLFKSFFVLNIFQHISIVLYWKIQIVYVFIQFD